jgi:hypothetical protein
MQKVNAEKFIIIITKAKNYLLHEILALKYSLQRQGANF